ncbi:FkbM family methyltransferase, partial [Trichormus variabilis FSR]
IQQSYGIQVPAKTLESILDKFAELPQIDFLSLDVEGYELDVLKGINLVKYQPKYILVEARFFEEINLYLSFNYDLIDQLSHHDYLYRLKSANKIQ